MRLAHLFAAASALTLAACVGDAGKADRAREKTRLNAGAPLSLSVCDRGDPLQLAPELTLERDVDYVADIDGRNRQSEHGTACKTATDREGCQSVLRDLQLSERVLVTTEGDAVRVWNSTSATSLIGEIDVLEEALWMVAARGYRFDCDTKAGDEEAGFRMGKVTREDHDCFGRRVRVELLVRPDATLEELSAEVDLSIGCGTPPEPDAAVIID